MSIQCVMCGGQMEERIENRAYSPAPGVMSVTLKDAEVLYCPSCGEESVGIPAMGKLLREIAKATARKEDRLTPQEIRFLRTHMGWNGVQFAEEMGVTPQAVSRWENDKTPMGPTAEKLLRVYVLYVGPTYEEEEPEEKKAEPAPGRLRMELIDGNWQTEQVA